MTPGARRWIIASAIGSVVLVVLLIAASRTYAAPSLTVQCADPSGPDVTLCAIYQDPDIHHGSTGTTLFSASKATTATIALPDGEHRIAVRSSATTSAGTNTSVLVFNLGTPCPEPAWRSLGFQAWWSDPGADPTFGSRHEHIDGLCWPVNNLVVDGPQTFAMTVQLHNQPSGAVFYRWRITDCRPGGSCGDIFVKTSLPQPDAGGNLVWPTSIPVDLSKLSTGRHEFRFGVYVRQPNGKVQLLSTRAQIAIRATSPAYRSLSSFPLLQGNGGWYTDSGYVDARFRSVLP